MANEFVPYLRRHWIHAGLLYGVITFFVMNYAVVPLSAVGKVHAFTSRWVIENMLAMLLFGLIITYVERSSAPVTRASASL
jgi:type VI protein secretion system component VasK